MVQNLTNKRVKYFVTGLFLLIISLFFFLNQNYYKQNTIKDYKEFKTESNNIHSLIKDKIQNQYYKNNVSVKKGQSLNVILSEAGASQKEILNISKILGQ